MNASPLFIDLTVELAIAKASPYSRAVDSLQGAQGEDIATLEQIRLIDGLCRSRSYVMPSARVWGIVPSLWFCDHCGSESRSGPLGNKHRSTCKTAMAK